MAIAAVAEGYLLPWLDQRKALGINGRNTVFCTLEGGPVSTAYARGLIRRLAERAEIERRIHWHGLRHAFASELAGEGVPINLIQAALGHSSLVTTVRYIQEISPVTLVAAMSERS